MKKALLILVVALGLAATTTSCGYGGSIKTDNDSLAYALGIDIGSSLWNNIDSTMNADLVCQGIQDVFAKKLDSTKMTAEQAQEYIRYYFADVMPKKKAEANDKASQEFLAAAEKEGAQKTTTGLLYKITEAGAEAKVALGDTVTAHYVLSDATGKVLQSSKESGQPMTYTNDAGAMIPGFTEGVSLIGEGGKAVLYIPFDLGYGEQGNGFIGPKQALKFEVEVLKVVKPTATPAK